MAQNKSVAFKIMNQEFVKLNQYDGTNFNQKKAKMMFLLLVLNLAFVFDLNT